MLGTVNLSNWFGGCKGEPRTFEVSALYGLGWMHVFTNNKLVRAATENQRNRMTSKAALDFAFNFGSAKQFQFYVEPSINFAFLGQSKSKELAATGNALAPVAVADHQEYGYKAASQAGQPAYNINNSFVQLNAGLAYKFALTLTVHTTSQSATSRDQAEIDALNATDQRAPATVSQRLSLREVVKEVVKEVPLLLRLRSSLYLTSYS